jgi:hypothetical protein
LAANASPKWQDPPVPGKRLTKLSDELEPILTPEEEIEQMKTELLVMGFALAKDWIEKLGLSPKGNMVCPLCQKILSYSISPINGHMAATCETENCIKMME